ncbi:MAG: hypothetical protein CMM01_15470 [Rhodopirellula sp.]|nr:hypothetical protein [Rhodopirellula sp.]
MHTVGGKAVSIPSDSMSRFESIHDADHSKQGRTPGNRFSVQMMPLGANSSAHGGLADTFYRP